MDLHYPLILDGATGTQLQKRGLPAGACAEKWILENPWAIKEVQSEYASAGSKVVYAPTFSANAAMLERHHIFNKVEEYNCGLVSLSREAVGDRALVAGDMTSAGSMLYPLGDVSFEDMYETYLEQAKALEKAGVDLFIIETMTDIAETRAAVLAVKAASSRPVFVTFTCDKSGRTMMGTDVCAALTIMEGMGADAFGLNCSVGPEDMLSQIKRLNLYASVPIIVKPNAGLPETVDGETVYNVGPEQFAAYIPQFIDAGARIFGACCGSNADYIKALSKALEGLDLGHPEKKVTDSLMLATGKDIFCLPIDAECTEIFKCTEDLEDDICDLDEGELFGIDITSDEDAQMFADLQYAIRNPLCIMCDNAKRLEKVLREYQGRAMYRGPIDTDVLAAFAEKYGLIY